MGRLVVRSRPVATVSGEPGRGMGMDIWWWVMVLAVGLAVLTVLVRRVNDLAPDPSNDAAPMAPSGSNRAAAADGTGRTSRRG